ANEKGGLHTVADSATLSRPLYAIWLQNSDKYSLICDLLKTDVRSLLLTIAILR
ncbi:hypothetical protein MJN69_29925, partial [Salmonella enterica subsp. enterica serovar Kentucky]|nr:hypothetical protein [Salmonella enterica subsp. enterica serovar Kentucky]